MPYDPRSLFSGMWSGPLLAFLGLFIFLVHEGAATGTYPLLLASYPPDTTAGLHAGVYMQTIPDLVGAPALEAAVSLRVPSPLPNHPAATLTLRGTITVNWRCSALRHDGEHLPPLDASLRIFASTFQCAAGGLLCPQDQAPLATYPLNLTAALATQYPPIYYGEPRQLRLPFQITLPRATLEGWAAQGVLWLAPLVRLPRYSPTSEVRNEVRWLASRGPSPAQWEVRYAVRDQHDILLQGWTNWTAHTLEVDRYFGLLGEAPVALALEAYLEAPRVATPTPPAPSSETPSEHNTTTAPPAPIRPPWYRPPPSVVVVPPTALPAAVTPRRELFTMPAVVAALLTSGTTLGILALSYTAGRERRYDDDVPIDKHLEAERVRQQRRAPHSASSEDEDEDDLSDSIVGLSDSIDALQIYVGSRAREAFGDSHEY